MADVNTNTATQTQTQTQTQEQGNGTQTNTTANANTAGAGADNTPKVKTEEEIRAELQKEYEKMADKRVTDAIKKKEKEWADKQAKEKMTEDERRQAEEQERLQAQAKRDLDLTIKLEGAEAGEVITSTRGSLSNVCQIIEKVTQVSGTAQALNPLGIGNSFTAEVNDRLVETKRDMEWYFINGTKTLEQDTTPRQMNGLLNLVNTENVIDATDTGLTEDLLLDALQKMWDHGAQGEYFTFVNATVKRLINKLAKSGDNIRFVKGDEGVGKAFGVTYNRFESDFGVLNMVLNRHVKADALLAVDLEQVQIAELRPTFYEDLPKGGDYEKGHIINESTIKLLNSYASTIPALQLVALHMAVRQDRLR